jgi:hypothetical protein
MLMNEFTLNVNVGMGATNPQDQVKQFISGMTALREMLADDVLTKQGLVVGEVIKELFGKLGYRDGSRFFDTEQQDPQIAQMQQTIEQLQQALDAKMPPELLAATVRKIDAETASLGVKDKVQAANAVKQGTEAQFSAMQTAEVIAAVPAVAPIADELMRAAGYVVPNPPGVDPNFPQPGMADQNLGIKDVANKRTGMVFTPGVATPGDATAPATQPQAAPSTTLNPLPPTPPTSGVGERHGIETLRPDSAPGAALHAAAMANGGMVHGYGYANGGLVYDDSGRAMARGYRGGSDPEANPEHPDDPTFPFVDTRPDPPPPPRQVKLIRADSLLDGLMSQSRFLADGGLIAGPGTGTSDSIAAQAGGTPLAVSNGEYRIPAAVVAALGQDFFDKLIEQFHTPSGAPDGAMPTAAGGALPLENGDFIVPADVVAALGADFFDKLVELYGGAQ